MPLFGPPNIDKMLQNHDLKGLVKALRHKDINIRGNAVIALGQLGDAAAVDPLLGLHQDYLIWDKYVPDALRQLGSNAVGSLIEIMQREPAGKLQIVAAESLKLIGGQQAADALLTTMKSTNNDLAREAMLAVAALKDERAYEPVMEALKKQTSWVPVLALERLGDTRAVPALIELLQHEDDHIRSSVARALGALGASQAIEPLVKAYWAETNYYQGAQRIIHALMERIQNSSEEAKVAYVAMLRELTHYTTHRAEYRKIIEDQSSETSLKDIADYAYSGYLDSYVRNTIRYMFPELSSLHHISPLASRLSEELDPVRPKIEASLKTLLASLDLADYYEQSTSKSVSGKCVQCEKGACRYRCARCQREFCEACITGFGYEAAQMLIEKVYGKSQITFGTANIFDEAGRAFCPHCYGILLMRAKLTGNWTVQSEDQREPSCVLIEY